MADFQPFNLGSVLQTAEAIKAARAQSTTDRLRERYLGEQIQASRDARDRQKRLDDVTLGKEKAQQVYTSMQHVMQAQNPKNFMEQNFPELVTNLGGNGVQWETLDDEGVKQMAQGIMAKAGAEAGIAAPTPVSAQGKLVQDQRAGFLTADQVAAANAPKNGTDYDNFLKAQKDPAFAQFLKDKRGKGFSMTLPDGTVVEMGGPGGGVGPGELSKPTINNLQELIVNSSNRLDRLNQLFTAYKPEYLQAKGLVKAATSEAKDFLGMDVSEEDKKFLSGYSEFRATASQEFSATLKELSGSAATEAEVQRVMKGVPSDKDKSPTAFEAKARATTKFITRAIMRANWALKNGIGVQSVDELSKRMPLEGIDGVYEARANQIWQELGGTPETKTQAIEEANKEFGLAR
jgi:hypothetical protein